MQQRISFFAVVLLASTLHASTDGDLLQKQINSMPKDDDARGANAVVLALVQTTTKSKAAKHFADRRQYDLMTLQLQDLAAKMNSPEAQKIFAAQLPRLPLETQMALCFGLKLAAPNPSLDAAALKLLEPKADNRLKVALIELLAAHRVYAAVPKVQPLLTPEAFFSVQVAACRALASLPDKTSVPVLLKFMEPFKAKGNGRLMYEAVAALRSITGEKLSADHPAWARWWQENQSKLIVDTNRAAAPEFNFEQKTDDYEVTYYDIPVVENRIVFVIDMSGSMQFGGNPSRWDSASGDLKKIIARLDDKQQFNIIAFASGTNRWKRKEALVPASELNRKEAAKFIDSLKALGGTQTTDVMEDVIRDIAAVSGCEAVYLVTDGSPNPWAKDITSAIQERYITWYNQPWKVRINTIGIYTTTAKEKTTVAKEEDQEGMKAFLYNLAANNDGIYREIGKN